jgi:hypothetical protein
LTAKRSCGGSRRSGTPHDLDGIIDMFTDDVVFEASFGEAPWGTRAVGKAAARELIASMIERVPDIRWDEIRHFVGPKHATVESVTTGDATRWRALRGPSRGRSHASGRQDHGEALLSQGEALSAPSVQSVRSISTME